MSLLPAWSGHSSTFAFVFPLALASSGFRLDLQQLIQCIARDLFSFTC